MNTPPTLPALEALFKSLHPIERLQQLYHYFTSDEILSRCKIEALPNRATGELISNAH